MKTGMTDIGIGIYLKSLELDIFSRIDDKNLARKYLDTAVLENENHMPKSMWFV